MLRSTYLLPNFQTFRLLHAGYSRNCQSLYKSSVSPSYSHSISRFYSEKKDDFTMNQKFFNSTFGKIPGFEKIEESPCNKNIILTHLKEHIESKRYVQISHLCLFEVAMIVDNYNCESKSFFDSSVSSGLTSKTIGKTRMVSQDPNLEYFINSHINNNSLDKLENGRQFTVNTKEFITAYVGHSVLTNKYISAQELQKHFQNTRQPVYTFLSWGDTQDTVGYNQHAVLVIGVDSKQKIHYYDVSNTLPITFSRFRDMSISEFNSRRHFPTESVFSRSYFFYKK